MPRQKQAAGMSDDALAALVADPLTPFEDRQVLRSAVEIPGAAGGLRTALRFDPIELHTDETCYVLLECEVGKIRFDPIKDTEAYCRVHILQVADGGAAFVDGEFAAEHLRAARDRVARLKEKAQGVERLPVDDGDGGE